MRRKCPKCEMTIHSHETSPRRNANGDRMLTVATAPGDHSSPMIRIRGHWLAKMGFRIGERIAVTAEKKRLVLTIERN